MLCRLIQNSSMALAGIQAAGHCCQKFSLAALPCCPFQLAAVPALQTQQSMVSVGQNGEGKVTEPLLLNTTPEGCTACGKSCRY